MDMQKLVLKLYLHDDKDKQKVMRAVSSVSGVASLAMDMKEKKLTVIGNVDTVAVVSKLRKICQTDLLTVGPAKVPEKKKEEPKQEDKQMEELIKAYSTHGSYLKPCYYNHCTEENPNACVIC